MDIYVGNLAYEVRDSDLQDAFAAYGEVESARVVMDRGDQVRRADEIFISNFQALTILG